VRGQHILQVSKGLPPAGAEFAKGKPSGIHPLPLHMWLEEVLAMKILERGKDL
jgi:hypothetical protein